MTPSLILTQDIRVYDDAGARRGIYIPSRAGTIAGSHIRSSYALSLRRMPALLPQMHVQSDTGRTTRARSSSYRKKTTAAYAPTAAR